MSWWETTFYDANYVAERILCGLVYCMLALLKPAYMVSWWPQSYRLASNRSWCWWSWRWSSMWPGTDSHSCADPNMRLGDQPCSRMASQPPSSSSTLPGLPAIGWLGIPQRNTDTRGSASSLILLIEVSLHRIIWSVIWDQNVPRCLSRNYYTARALKQLSVALYAIIV